MAIPLFPELQTRLTRAFGPGVERDMLHQFVFWFNWDRHPKMRVRWWLYKTFAEWYAERGLSRRNIDKGRASLTKAGIIEEAKGPYKRIHYRVDWVKLADRLNLTLNPIAHPESGTDGVGKAQTSEKGRAVSDCPPENGHEPHSYAGEPREDGVQYRLHAPDTDYSAYLSGEPPENGVQSNTVDYAGDYLQESYLYRGDADGSSNHRTPTTVSSEEKIEEGKGSSEPLTDHDGVATKTDPAPERPNPETVALICKLIEDPKTKVGELARGWAEGDPITSRQVAEAVALRQDEKPATADRYLATVEEALRDLKEDMGKVTA